MLTELDPAERPWRYNGLGQKIWKDLPYIKLWTVEDQANYEAEKNYEEWKLKYGHDWIKE
jgi:hypothetical protein